MANMFRLKCIFNQTPGGRVSRSKLEPIASGTRMPHETAIKTPCEIHKPLSVWPHDRIVKQATVITVASQSNSHITPHFYLANFKKIT
jgi:hypothetical protein